MFGTLIRPDPSVAQQYYEAAYQFVDERRVPSVETIDRRFQVAFRNISSAGHGLRYGSTDAEGYWFWKRVIGSVFPALDDETLKRLTRRLYRHFAEAGAWRIYSGGEEVLEWLRRHGYRIGLLTNWDTRATRLLKNLGLSAYMNEIVVSSEIGVEKPDPDVFHIIHRRLRTGEGRVVMLGNSVEVDLRVPEEMGWLTYLFSPGSEETWKREIDEWAKVPERLLTEDD